MEKLNYYAVLSPQNEALTSLPFKHVETSDLRTRIKEIVQVPFEKHLQLDPKTLQKQTRRLTENVCKFSLNPENRGTSTTFKQKYFKSWVEMDDEGSLKISVVPERSVIGIGATKKTNSQLHFNIPADPSVPYSHSHKVLLRIATSDCQQVPYNIEELIDAKKQLLKEFQWRNDNIRLFKRTPSLSAPLIPLLPNISMPYESEYTYTQQWYNCTLEDALTKGFVPLDPFQNSEKRSYTFEELILCILDIFESVECLHASKQIHRDIRPPNILLEINKYNDQCHLNGVLNDFDYVTGPIKENCIENPQLYPYLDLLSKNGYSTPFVDLFSLIMVLGRIIFGKPFLSLICNDNILDLINTNQGNKSAEFILNKILIFIKSSLEVSTDCKTKAKLCELENKMKAIKLSLGNDFSVSRFLLDYLESNDAQLIQETYEQVKNLYKMSCFLEEIWKLIVDVLRANKIIYDQFLANPKLLEIINNENPQERCRLFGIFDQVMPNMRLSVIRYRIEEMLQELQTQDYIT